MSRVVPAACPVPGHAWFTGGSALPHPVPITPVARPVPAAAGDQGRSRDAVVSRPTDPNPDEILWLLAEAC